MNFSVCVVAVWIATSRTHAQYVQDTSKTYVNMLSIAVRHVSPSQSLSLHRQAMTGSCGGSKLQGDACIRLHKRTNQDRDRSASLQSAQSSPASSHQIAESSQGTDKQQSLRIEKRFLTSTTVDAGASRDQEGKTSQSRISIREVSDNHQASQVAGLVLAHQEQQVAKSTAAARNAKAQADRWRRKSALAAMFSSCYTSPYDPRAVCDKYRAEQHRHEKDAADANDVKHRLLQMGARYPGQVDG